MKNILLILGLTLLSTSATAKDQEPKNRLRLLGGFGRDVKVEKTSSAITVTEYLKPIYGFAYDRKLNYRIPFVVGGQYLSNQSFVGSVGFDF